MKRQIKNILDRLPYISGLRSQVDELGLFPAGHYYSPIPSRNDVTSRLQSNVGASQVLDVDLRASSQLALLKELSQYYDDLPFPENKHQDCRYYFNQSWFCYTDAIMLYGFLRHFNPKRIIEIGAGFSTAVMLDTLDKFFTHDSQVTLVEPFPDRLNELLRPEDRARVTIFDKVVQEIDMQVFESLDSGDLLFIDSSHVMKFGSDLYKILFEILPILPAGVHVHFHDIFYPFEYPGQWLMAGRYWNECYVVRAFLAFNSSWEITLFNHYANQEFPDLIEKHMPLCRKNFGGSLYLRRTRGQQADEMRSR